jgi:hypothetical protein
MDDLRALIGILIFSISCYLTYDLLINGFNLWVLIAIICGFLFVHVIWPKKTNADNAWYEVLQVIVELPYQAIALLVRGISRVFKGVLGDTGLDV